MGCNCKKKRQVVKSLESSTPTYTFDELEEVYMITQTKIYPSAVEIDMMYDLHNRIYPLNKQYNKNCGDCYKRVVTNIINAYEREKTIRETEGLNS